MAVPCSFNESNMVFSAPKGMTSDECSALAAMLGVLPNGDPVIVSCWKLTQKELDEINRTGRVWLTVFGTSMPPVNVHGNRPT